MAAMIGDAGLAVYYIDLDEFKKVNDLGGHDAGDDMLLRVASCLKLTLGELATVARIGGDEFAAMLPVTSRETAHEYAEKILEGFGRIRLEIKDRVFTISGSVGVAFIADGTMRRKRHGRKRTAGPCRHGLSARQAGWRAIGSTLGGRGRR